jgi:hypothetical protein
MQRIDENTYIDDTLVTCAEYQLFIDEMREQGKYYQPDHWTSYQFPEGQARDPILGMRYSDAIAFCKWLTQRQGGEWKFRLPKQEEANALPMTSLGKSLLGCWVDGNDNFVWIGAVPKNPRNLDFEALNRARNYTLTYALNRALDRALDFDLNRVIDLALKPNRCVDTIDHARGLANTLFSTRTRDRALDLDHNHDKALANAISIARDLVLVLDLDLASTRDLNLTLDRDLGVYFYVDLYTLQERIAGRSPAFEGIRLVKYR